VTDTKKNLRREPRQVRSRERVDTILAAAQSLIGQTGLAALTMKDIAVASGMPLATVYHYFPNRSAVMAELYRRFSDRVTGLMRDTLAAIAAPEDLLWAADAMVNSYFALLKDEPAIQDLLNAVQADKDMRNMDIAQTRLQATAFCEATQRFIATSQRENFDRSVYLVFQLAGAAVRLGLFLGGEDGERIVDDYKRLIRGQLSEFDIRQF
jgi:AcrR family transcriptional regulator